VWSLFAGAALPPIGTYHLTTEQGFHTEPLLSSKVKTAQLRHIASPFASMR